MLGVFNCDPDLIDAACARRSSTCTPPEPSWEGERPGSDPTRMAVAVVLADGDELCVGNLAWVRDHPAQTGLIP